MKKGVCVAIATGIIAATSLGSQPRGVYLDQIDCIVRTEAAYIYPTIVVDFAGCHRRAVPHMITYYGVHWADYSNGNFGCLCLYAAK